MKNKICLITGANAGIGKFTAMGLAKSGAKVIMVSRNKEKGQKALQEIVEKTGNNQVELLTADFASFESVKKLALEFLSKYNKLDVLINNAGTFFSELQYSKDGIEMQFAVNHLAPFLLTNLLLDTLKKSSSSRIINVSSKLHYRGSMDFDDLYLKAQSAERLAHGVLRHAPCALRSAHKKGYDGLKAYCQSKLANVLFTYELSRRLEGTGITVNCLHPGGVRTGLANKNASGIYKIGWIFIKPFMISPVTGAKTSIYLASSNEVEGITGKYFDKCKPQRSSRISCDREIAGRLWEVSEELTGISM